MIEPHPASSDHQKPAGFILCGGRSRRFSGEDKGLKTLNGVPMVHATQQRLSPQVSSIRVVSNRNTAVYQELGLAPLSDQLPGFLGPLAGIHAALCSLPQDQWAIVTPCDTPFIPLDLVSRLYAEKNAAAVDIVVCHDGQRLQPLMMLIHAQQRPRIEQFLHQKRYSVQNFLDNSAHAVVDFSDQPEAFHNINRIEDMPHA